MTKRQTFTKAFKAEAVRLLEQSGKPAAEVARELGVRRNQLYKWQAQITAQGAHAFPGSETEKGGQATFLVRVCEVGHERGASTPVRV